MQPTSAPIQPNLRSHEKSATEIRLENTKHFTKKAYKIAKFPFFIRGCQCILNARHATQPMTKSLGPVMGIGMILFSPIGLGVNILAAGFAAGGGIAAGAAKLADMQDKNKNPEAYRKYLTEEFVNSLAERLAALPNDQQEMYKENPELLVGAEAIAIGFLARGYYGNGLYLGNAHIEAKDLDSDFCKEYLRQLVAIKEAIRELGYSREDDNHAWTTFQNEAELLNADALEDEFRKEKLKIIDREAKSFANRAQEDEQFIAMWRAKFS